MVNCGILRLPPPLVDGLRKEQGRCQHRQNIQHIKHLRRRTGRWTGKLFRANRVLYSRRVRKTFCLTYLARRDECPPAAAIRGQCPGTASGIGLQLLISKRFTLGRQRRAVVRVSPSVYLYWEYLSRSRDLVRTSFAGPLTRTNCAVGRGNGDAVPTGGRRSEMGVGDNTL